MNKVIVEVYCPALSKNYDMWISKKMLIGDVIKRIIEEISIYEDNDKIFKSSKEIDLFHCEQSGVLMPQRTVEESGIISGNRLMIL